MTNQQTDELKQLPLATIHRDAGAPMMGLCGWEAPAHFGDPEGEYNAASNGVALFDASFLTKVRATGGDHIEYLNRRLSQRVIETEPGVVVRANQLSGDGRMEADLEFIRVKESESLLVAPPAVAGNYLQALADKYVFTEDAAFVDETPQWGTVALIGPKAGEVLEALNLPTPEAGQMNEGKIGEANVMTHRSEYFFGSILLHFDVGDAGTVWKTVKEAVEKSGGRPLGFLAFDTLRVEHGAAWWGIDLTERSIPLEADLMTAIHTNKGCYPGQETIAKILNLGHPARKLTGISFEGEDPPAPGSPLTVDGREVGQLSSSTWSPRLGRPIGLAMMKWAQRNPGTEVTTPEGLKGTVTALPFD